MNPRSIDAQQIRPVIRVNSEGRVLFVALERQWCILETVARQGRSPDAAKPQKLPAPAQRRECVHADDSCSDAPTRAILLARVIGRVVSRVPECAGMSLEGLGDLVADRDRAAGEDVGSKAAAMDERPKQSRACELLEVGTGFCESSPNALDRPYMEPLADERVQ